MADTYEKIDENTAGMTTKYPFSFLPYLLTGLLMVSPTQYGAVGRSTTLYVSANADKPSHDALATKAVLMPTDIKN